MFFKVWGHNVVVGQDVVIAISRTFCYAIGMDKNGYRFGASYQDFLEHEELERAFYEGRVKRFRLIRLKKGLKNYIASKNPKSAEEVEAMSIPPWEINKVGLPEDFSLAEKLIPDAKKEYIKSKWKMKKKKVKPTPGLFDHLLYSQDPATILRKELEDKNFKGGKAYHKRLTSKHRALMGPEPAPQKVYLKGKLFLTSFSRIVCGAHGPYVEFEKDQLVMTLKMSPEKHKKYRYFYPIGFPDVKIYYQLETVGYADYQSGRYYIDFYEAFCKSAARAV